MEEWSQHLNRWYDPRVENAYGMKYSNSGRPTRGDLEEDKRIEQSVALEQAERLKLDALAERKAYAWKRRAMLQRSKRN